MRTLEIVEFFAGQAQPQRLSQVARALNLSRATAYQRLFTLIEAGWLEQDDLGRYRLSLLPLRLAAAATEQADLGIRADPALNRLMSTVGETASLSVLDRGRPCIVARVESESLLRATQAIGTYLDLEGSASGRVHVAFGDETTLARLRRGGAPLPQEAVLNRIRDVGYALSSGYSGNGVKAMAAPVRDVHGCCTAAVSVVAPEYRFDLARFEAPLQAAATEISRMLQNIDSETRSRTSPT